MKSKADKAKNAGRRNTLRETAPPITVHNPLRTMRVAWCLRCRASTTQQVTTTVISEDARQRMVRCERCGYDIENTIQPIRADGRGGQR